MPGNKEQTYRWACVIINGRAHYIIASNWPRCSYVSKKSYNQLISWSIHDIFNHFFYLLPSQNNSTRFYAMFVVIMWSSSTRALVARFRGIPLLAVFHGRFHGIPRLEGESHFKRLCTWRSHDHKFGVVLVWQQTKKSLNMSWILEEINWL